MVSGTRLVGQSGGPAADPADQCQYVRPKPGTSRRSSAQPG